MGDEKAKQTGELRMRDITKMWLCIIGLILSTQVQWFIPKSEIFNGIGLLFGIGFGWYAKCVKSEQEGRE